EIAVIALAEHRDLQRLLDIPVIGQRRMAFESELSGRPDVDEIRRDAPAVGVEDPPVRPKRRRKERRVDDQQHEADVAQRCRNVTWRFRGKRCWRDHAQSSAWPYSGTAPARRMIRTDWLDESLKGNRRARISVANGP